MLSKLLWAHVGDLPAGWPLLGHSHPFYHLMYLRSGRTTFLLDHVPYTVSAGDCLIVPPGVRHEITDSAHTLFDTYEIKFELHSPQIEAVLNQRGPVIRGNQAYLEKTLQYIVYSWSRPDPFVTDKLDGLLDSLLMSIYLEKNISPFQSSAFIDTSSYSELTNQIIKYLEDNQTEVFHLDDLTRAFGYNKRYLCTAFRKNTGVTILEYLNHIRIRQAASHLHYHNVPIAVVGQYVGFVTPIHFTRVFKQLVGITPSLFREVFAPGEENSAGAGNSRGRYAALYEETLATRLLPLETSTALLRYLGDIAAGRVPPPQPNQP